MEILSLLVEVCNAMLPRQQWFLTGGARDGTDMNVTPAWARGYTGKVPAHYIYILNSEEKKEIKKTLPLKEAIGSKMLLSYVHILSRVC